MLPPTAVNVPFVPLLTATSVASKPVTASLKVNVKRIGLAFVGLPPAVTDSVGAVRSLVGVSGAAQLSWTGGGDSGSGLTQNFPQHFPLGELVGKAETCVGGARRGQGQIDEVRTAREMAIVKSARRAAVEDDSMNAGMAGK